MPRNNLLVRVHRPAGGGDPRVPVPAAAGRPGLGELRLHPLGPGRRLVQQYRVERRAAHPQAVQPRPGALRVEQASGEDQRDNNTVSNLLF
jgi:hypothetical protein